MLTPKEYWIYAEKTGNSPAEWAGEWIDAVVRSEYAKRWFTEPHDGIRHFPYIRPADIQKLPLSSGAVHDRSVYRFTAHDEETGFPVGLLEKGAYLFKPAHVDDSNREFVGACYIYNNNGIELRADVAVDQYDGRIGVRKCYSFDPFAPARCATKPAMDPAPYEDFIP